MMSATNIVSAPSAPEPSDPPLGQDELKALDLESADTGTLLGVSAMKARLLYQAVGYLAQLAAPSAVTLNPVCLDQKTIDAIGAALHKVLADTFQHQLDAANCAIADLKKSRTDDETRIVQLQTAASACQQEAQTLTERIGRLEEHNRQAQAHYETLTCQVRELREEVMALIEVECREPCGRMAADMALLAERIDASNQILSRLKESAFKPIT
jgi:septal ring factor EnvC (AmiA/AmiB activator)